MKHLKALFTDGEWDADLVKIMGVALIVIGLVGFFMGKAGFEWVIGFGAGMATSGKFSKQG